MGAPRLKGSISGATLSQQGSVAPLLVLLLPSVWGVWGARCARLSPASRASLAPLLVRLRLIKARNKWAPLDRHS